MAVKRMFTQSITTKANFLMMPLTSQALYFHLGLYADDDGFVEAFAIMRMIGANEQDLKVLEANRFIKVFENYVVHIVDWKQHNSIKSDRYKPSQYIDLIQTTPIEEQKVVQVLIGSEVEEAGSTMEPERVQPGTSDLGLALGLDKEKKKDKKKSSTESRTRSKSSKKIDLNLHREELIAQLTAEEIDKLKTKYEFVDVDGVILEFKAKNPDYLKKYTDAVAVVNNWCRNAEKNLEPAKQINILSGSQKVTWFYDISGETGELPLGEIRQKIRDGTAIWNRNRCWYERPNRTYTKSPSGPSK